MNAVNALNIAKARGIKITEGKTDDAKGYDSLVKVRAKSATDNFSAEGTFIHEPKIVKINEYWVDVKPAGDMFIAKYKDVPGTILAKIETTVDLIHHYLYSKIQKNE